MNRSTSGLSLHQQLPEFTQTHIHRVSDAIQPSHPLSSSSPPAPNPSQHQSLFQWVSSSHEVAKVLEFQPQHQSFQWAPRTDLLQNGLVGSPCSPRDSQESSPTPQFKSRGIILSTKVHLVKAMVFPVAMYGCESWTINKAEHWRIDAFKLWRWRRLLRVPWTARRSNQSILKGIGPGCSLEGLMLKLKLQYSEELTHLKKPWCWGRLRAREEGDDRGWDG